MINLCGLWLNEKDGKKWFSGKMGNTRVLIFKNDKKEPGSNQPDYNLCLAPFEKKEDKPAEQQQPAENNLNDEVPF